MADDLLYYGDNLDVLRRYVKDESVDLIYLDPPFKSEQNYNVLFAEKNGTESAAQIKAFEDTWHWDQAAAEAFHQTLQMGGQVARAMTGFETLLGTNDMLAYLSMMAPRLMELRRVLKPTGSIYLHCDPTASHYLKVLMDAVFGPVNFRTEITWKRSAAHSDTKQGRKQHGRIHDILLFYTKSDEWTWNPVYTPYDQEYIESSYRHVEEGTGRRFKSTDLTAAKPGGDTEYEWKGRRPAPGRYWAYSKENMQKFEQEGRLYYTRSGLPRQKQYLEEMPGVALQDVWNDIPPISSQAAERLGYPTQKPERLLERIVASSSTEGDTVLDPFCGCGTTIAVAQRLGRRWIGIDITHLAITLIKHRLKDAFGDQAAYKVIGEPVSVSGAEELAGEDPFQFEAWALGLVGARPAQVKRGADKGIDGRLYFLDEGEGSKVKQAILSVKSGKTGRRHVHELRGVVEREGAAIGVLITLQDPTQPMRSDAAAAGFYDSPGWGQSYPRMQILTVAELLEGKGIEMPPVGQASVTFKKAAKQKGKASHEQLTLDQG